jgi:hypothetical protein
MTGPRTGALVVMLVAAGLVGPRAGWARECLAGCAMQTRACVRTAKVTRLACRQACHDGGASATLRSCFTGCKTTFEADKRVCGTDHGGCVDACLPLPPPSSCDAAFLDTCGRQLAICARGVVTQARACVLRCPIAGGRLSCLQGCAGTARSDAAQCASAFGVCVTPCGPSTTTTTLPGGGCTTDGECNDGNPCTADHCVDGICDHACLCLDATGSTSCCPGPSALCARPCGSDASGTCGGTCPAGASCGVGGATSSCGCVSGLGGPCGGNVLDPPPVCAAGLVCQQSNPDATGTCVAGPCIPFFANGCTQTSDCCSPCTVLGRAPCAVCLQGQCSGTP